MSHKMFRSFIVKVSVLGYFALYKYDLVISFYIDYYIVNTYTYTYNTYCSFKYMLTNYYNYNIIFYKYIIYYSLLVVIISGTNLGIHENDI